MSTTPLAQIMLLTPKIEDAAEFIPQLEAALHAAPVAAVNIALGNLDPHTLLNAAKTLVALCQNAGAAALLCGNADIVGKSGADGLHVNGTYHLQEMVERFRPKKIVGAGGLRLKDDAMRAGEWDVDYVMFGEPEASPLPIPFEAIADRVAWWAEIFEVPCVAYAPQLQHIPELVKCNADFIALSSAVWNHPDGVEVAMRTAHQSLAPNAKADVG